MAEKQFVASFHTHAGALLFYTNLKKRKELNAKLKPVPREISTSCGTAVFFEKEFDESMADRDIDSVYLIKEDGGFERIYMNDQL